MTLTFYNGSSITTLDSSLESVRSQGYRLDDIEWIKDDVGGLHSEGLGWSPDGNFCGACSNIECTKCSVYIEEKHNILSRKANKTRI